MFSTQNCSFVSQEGAGGGLAPSLPRRKTTVFCRKQGGHVCCSALPSHTGDMSAVSHSRRARCGTQHTCLLCRTADMSARHVCCVTQQTCLLHHTEDISAVSQSGSLNKVIAFLGSREQPCLHWNRRCTRGWSLGWSHRADAR